MNYAKGQKLPQNEHQRHLAITNQKFTHSV